MNRRPEEITVHELWQVLLKRRLTIFLCFALATSVALIFALILPTRYEGVGRLTLDFESNAMQWASPIAPGGVDGDTKLQTQVKVLETESLAWEVIRRLRLDQRSETAPRRFVIGPEVCVSGPNQTPDAITSVCRKMLLDEFHKRLRVQSLPRTQIIEIRYRCKSRELAARVVNTLADAFVETSFRTKYEGAMRASKWVSGQLTEAKTNAQMAEEKFISYQKQTGIIGTDENHNVLIERLNAINQQLVLAKANRIVHEARYRVSLSGDPEALVEMAPGSPLQVLHAEDVALKSQYAQLDAKFGEAYPRVQQLKAQLEKSNALLRAEVERSRDKVKSEYEAALRGETQLRDEFEQQKQEAYNTNEAAIQVALLKRDVDASRELYEQLFKHLNEAGVLAGLRSTTVTVIDPAGIPVDPVEPHRALNVAFGMFTGLFGGLVMCFLKENIDTTISTLDDVAHLGSVSALGIVPRLTDGKGGGISPALSKNGKVRIATLDRPEGEVADAYRSLRTALLLSNAGSPPKVILVTSALPREGKTTSSINIAVVFAQKNRRVLLVDGDLRRADLNHCLSLPINGGVSAALVGEDPSKFYVVHPDLPSLWILPAGERPPKPPDLLDSDRMRELVSSWRENFDHVIIDAPPVIGLSDAVIMATMADTVVLVVRAQQSRRRDFCHAQEILASVEANIGGAIINDFRLDSSGPYGSSSKLYAGYFSENESRNGNA